MATLRNQPSDASKRNDHLSEVERRLTFAMRLIEQGKREIERSRRLMGSEPVTPDTVPSDATQLPHAPSR
jgi:hypothetical protein